MISLSDVVLLFFAALAVVGWWRWGTQKQRALHLAARHCEQRGLQLLDQTLAFRHYRRFLDSRGRRRLCRVYQFEFSRDGEDRHSGEIAMAGPHALRLVVQTDSLEVTDFGG